MNVGQVHVNIILPVLTKLMLTSATVQLDTMDQPVRQVVMNQDDPLSDGTRGTATN